MNEIKSNMDKLIESGKIKLFASKHNGAWTHKDWLEFCKELEASGLAPLDLDEVGQLLEKEKKTVKNKIKKINDITEIKISKNQDIQKETVKTQKAEKKQENEKVTAQKTNTLPELTQTHLPSLSEVTLHNIPNSESPIVETGYKVFILENFTTLYNELIESILTACTKVNELNIKYYAESLNVLLKKNGKSK